VLAAHARGVGYRRIALNSELPETTVRDWLRALRPAPKDTAVGPPDSSGPLPAPRRAPEDGPGQDSGPGRGTGADTDGGHVPGPACHDARVERPTDGWLVSCRGPSVAQRTNTSPPRPNTPVARNLPP
jgi:hypothetical protein